MDLTKTHWKTIWEDNADLERKLFDLMAVEKLLEMVKAGDYGSYYGIWSAIADRATLKQAGRILLDVLYEDDTYTLRANCAEALMRLMNEKDIRGVDLTADRPDQNEFLEKIEEKMKELLGSRKGGLHD